MRQISLLLCLMIAVVVLAGCEQESAQTKDPLETLTYQYLDKVKNKDWDGAYAMLSDETQKYYPKEQFTEYLQEFVLPKVDALYVTRIEKHKLDASIETSFKPKSSWATYNTVESAKVKLEVVYKDGNWLITFPDIIAKGQEKEEKEKARQERVAKWEPLLKFNTFTVENKITDEGPMLVFNGEIENTGEETCEMLMVMVDFFDGKGEKVFNIVVVPIYISPYEKKDGLQAKEKEVFQSSISSEIPDTWSGQIKYRVFDAGDMPQKQ
jgi:hypothetical protein